MTREPVNVPDKVGTSDDEFDSLIEDASLPWDVVPLCLNAELRREYEEVKARIEGRAAERDAQATAAAAEAAGLVDVRMATPGPPSTDPAGRDPEQDRLDELAAKMQTQIVKVVVQALPSVKYNELIEKHPPRRNPATGRFDERDFQGFNARTFYPDLVKACIVKPTMTPERWKKFDAALTDIQFDKLANAAAGVNRNEGDIPFSPGDSEQPPT
jgi:hypothetical protein